jgi:tetratricopeptide (TPR) repeat protein
MLRQRASADVEQQRWADAKEPLGTLLEHYPSQTGEDCAYALLAEVHHRLGESDQERSVLERWAERDATAVGAYLRLMELGAGAEDWPSVALNAERCLAVNPLLPQPYHALAEAAEAQGEEMEAISAWESLLQLDPRDPAKIHYHLAQLLHDRRDPTARRHVLQALEEAPRFREAHRLLLRMVKASSAEPEPEPDAAEEQPVPLLDEASP